MADVILSDGREITFDLYRLTQREYAAAVRGQLTDAEYYALIARVTGLTEQEAGDLPRPDWRQLVVAFFRKNQEPLADPNSASASSSG